MQGVDNRNSEWKNLTVDARKDYIQNLFQNLQKEINRKQLSGGMKKLPIYKRLYKVAAAILLLAVAYSTFYLWGLKSGKATEDQLLTSSSTRIGEIKEVTLQDGTHIFLNAASELQYPSHFSGKTREVYLKGEAFFKVAHNADKPFIVHCGRLNTQVLGTSFNVNAYTDDDKVKITVLTGKVSVAQSDKPADGAVIITENEQLTYSSSRGQVTTTKIANVSDYSDWKDEKLTFYHSPMEEVAKVLRRTYGLKIKFKNTALKACKITGRFEKKQAPEDILKAICLSIGSNYEKQGDQITIEGSECK